MKSRIVKLNEDIMADEKEMALKIREDAEKENRFLINVMASPGAGKTSLILALLDRLKTDFDLSVLEGDVDSTIDTDKILGAGYRGVQIQTGGFCHLIPAMIEKGLALLGEEFGEAERRELTFIENIGNLICPAGHDLGEALKLVILSVPEGDDKPWKYPVIFKAADLVVLNKTDNSDYGFFRLKEFTEKLDNLNPGVPLFPVSCRTGTGLEELAQFIRNHLSGDL